MVFLRGGRCVVWSSKHTVWEWWAEARLNVHEACLMGAHGCTGWLGVMLPLRPVIKRTVPLGQGWEEMVGVKVKA